MTEKTSDKLLEWLKIVAFGGMIIIISLFVIAFIIGMITGLVKP